MRKIYWSKMSTYFKIWGISLLVIGLIIFVFSIINKQYVLGLLGLIFAIGSSITPFFLMRMVDRIDYLDYHNDIRLAKEKEINN